MIDHGDFYKNLETVEWVGLENRPLEQRDFIGILGPSHIYILFTVFQLHHFKEKIRGIS